MMYRIARFKHLDDYVATGRGLVFTGHVERLEDHHPPPNTRVRVGMWLLHEDAPSFEICGVERFALMHETIDRRDLKQIGLLLRNEDVAKHPRLLDKKREYVVGATPICIVCATPTSVTYRDSGSIRGYIYVCPICGWSTPHIIGGERFDLRGNHISEVLKG